MKNSSLAWYNNLTATLQEIGFTSSPSMPCLFTLKRGTCIVHMVVHVDHMCFIFNNRPLYDEIHDKLAAKYDFSSAGPLEHFLGMKITREAKTGNILLTQTAYIDTICKRFKQWIGPTTSKIDTPWLVGPAGRMSC